MKKTPNSLLYDADATALTKVIYSSLRQRGYQTEIECALAMQQVIESEILSEIKVFQGYLRDKKHKDALMWLKERQEENPLIDGLAISFADDMVNSPNWENRSKGADFLNKLGEALIGSAQKEAASSPINLLVAMDALFRLTVLQERMAHHAREVFSRVSHGKCEGLVLIDDAGRTVNSKVFGDATSFQSFKVLFDSVVERWDLQHLVKNTKWALTAKPELAVSDGLTNTNRILAKSFAAMFTELEAA